MTEFARLDGKRAVVTGGSSGIGRAIALELARAGADVLVSCARSVDRAQQVVDEIVTLGRQAGVLACDLRDLAAVERFPDLVAKQFGLPDIWVNNAGADLLTGPGPTWTYAEKLTALWDVDVRGAVLLARAVAQAWQAAGRSGVLLNIGWDQADRGMEGDSGELFATAKNAVMGLTRSLAMSYAPAIRVNCIAPGWIKTAWGESAPPVWQERVLRETPLKRWGTPEDIAKLARFLVSDDAGYITGQVVNCNGGAVR